MSSHATDRIRTFIGLGANLGDPVQQIVDARSHLYKLSSTVNGQCSSLYLSSPVGYDDQPNFINCVIELWSTATAHELFSNMQRIEEGLGRVRDVNNQNAPRMIDLDLLLFGTQNFEDNRLSVPHPRMHQRRFVIEPLQEVAPDLKISSGSNITDQILYRLSC